MRVNSVVIIAQQLKLIKITVASSLFIKEDAFYFPELPENFFEKGDGKTRPCVTKPYISGVFDGDSIKTRFLDVCVLAGLSIFLFLDATNRVAGVNERLFLYFQFFFTI